MADSLRVFEKHQQLFHRHAPAFLRDVLASFRNGTLKAAVAADQLGLFRSRLCALATGYGRATARKQGPGWRPGRSGGDHATPWPQPVLALLTKRRACSPPCPYSFVASEALRLHAFKLARAHVRRWALKFYDISLRYAPTPQAKGKVEREHQFWQGRLPPCSASEKITDMAVANRRIDALRVPHNTGEVHRELDQTPHRAWEQARKEKRSALRPAPRCPWWDVVWSVRTTLKTGTDGRVPIGTQRLRIEKPPGTKVVLGHHPTATTPCWPPRRIPQQKPVLRFTNRPG